MRVECQYCGSEIEVEIIGTSEAAEICGIGIHGIIVAIKRGFLDAVKIRGGGQRGAWVMSRREAERYRDERRSVGRPKRKPPAPAGGLNRPKKEGADE